MRRLYGENWTDNLNTDDLRTQLFPSGNSSYQDAHLPPQGGWQTRSFTDARDSLYMNEAQYCIVTEKEKPDIYF